MKSLNLVFGFIISVISSVHCQQIFDVPLTSCQYALAKNDTLQLQSNTFELRRKKRDVYVNLCTNVDNLKCGPKSVACIMDRGVAHNAGTKFEYINDEEDGKVLRSINGEKCDDAENYTITITFDKSTTAKPMPYIQSSDDCSVTIQFPHPSIIPYCTTKEKGHLLNMQLLKKLPPLTNTTNNVTYTISLCKAASSCLNSEIAGCEIIPNNTIIPISTVDSQFVRYDYKTNIVSIKSSYKAPNKKKKLETEVVLKCNWNVGMGALMKTAKKSGFEVETKEGCIKLPMNCLFSDDKNYFYNMTKLNRPTGWTVRNVTEGRMRLNVCGSLQFQNTNECNNTHSQICLNKRASFVSLGSTYVPIYEYDDAVYLDLSHGSTCVTTNFTGFYSSRIKFVCNKIEKGPVFTGETNCHNDLLWETPEVCPRYVTGELYNRNRLEDLSIKNIKQCTLKHEGLLYNLDPLINDKNYQIRDRNEDYFINICRPLLVTDNTYLCKSSGICINDLNNVNMKTKYTSLDTNRNPEIINGSLVVKYIGGYCSNFQSREAIVRFTCSEKEKPLYLISKSDCYIEFGWHTKHACPKMVHNIRSAGCIVRNSNLEKLVDLKNISTNSFKLQYISKDIYWINLCDHEYSVTIGNTTIKRNITNVYYKSEECSKVIEYVLYPGECKEQSLNRIHVHLDCSNNVYNQEYINHFKTENCTINLSLKSYEVCHLFTNTNCEHHEIKKITKQTEVTKRTLISTIDNIIQRNCTLSGEQGSIFILNDIPEYTVKSSNYYHIGYSKNNQFTDGFVRRNNTAIAFLNQCPNMDIDSIASEINVYFTIASFNTHLLFVCGIENDKPTILIETESEVKIKLPSQQACNILKHVGIDNITEAHTGLIIGIIILLISIAVIIFFIIKLRTKNCPSSRLIANEKSNVPIYHKDAEA